MATILPKKTARLTALILFVVLACSVFSQESTARDDTAETDLFESTLAVDIATAGYYELVAWCERLELSTRGSRDELQARLRAHYGVAADPEPVTSESKQPIEIKSANATSYYTDPDSNESYLELSGDVSIVMRDRDSKAVHTINADRILFNEAKNQLTASGNLEYSLEQSGETELFRGNSLSFSLDSWEGVFSQGTSTVDRDVDEDTVTFFYSGQTIYRLADDVVLLERGTITSSNPDDPAYRIDAATISILAPQEWALSHAVLYVGNVPLLYFPYFFHPGDELFLHPAIGFLDIQGYFVQTTTYLIGRKRDTTGSLSFLRVTEESEGSYDTEREGLFLRKQRRTESDDSNAGTQAMEGEDDYLKLLADIYSRHGLLLGIEGNLAGAGAVSGFSTVFGIVRSRNIVLSETGGYTYLVPREDGSYGSSWNSGFFLGIELPFRYGGSASLAVSTSWLTLDLLIAAHSDPFVTRDFFDRNEEIDWAGLLGIDESAGTGQTTGRRTDSYQWKLAGRMSPRFPDLVPAIQSVQVSRLDLLINWRNKTRPASDLDGVTTLEPTGYSSPDRYFFYPDSMSVPTLQGRINGTVFDRTFGSRSNRSQPVKPPDTSGPIPKPPWESSNDAGQEEDTPEATSPQTEGDRDIRVPDPIPSGSIGRVSTPTLYDHQLTYSVTPEVTLDYRFNSGAWTRPSEIMMFGETDPIEYALANTKAQTQLAYRSTLFGSLLTVNNSLNFQANLRRHFDPVDSSTDSWERLIDQDNTASQLKTTNTLKLTSKPVNGLDSWDSSTLSYELATTLYQRVFDENATSIEGSSGTGGFVNEPFRWEDEFVTSHQASARAVFQSPVGDQSLAFSTVLPPKDGVIELDGRFETWWLTTVINAGVANEDDTWEATPLSLTERIEPELAPIAGSYLETSLSYDPEERLFGESTSTLSLKAFDGKISLGQSFTYDVEEGRPVATDTTLSIDWFDARFVARRTRPYEFIPGVGWQIGTEEEFLPSTARFQATYRSESRRFWKNRMEVGGSVIGAWNLQLLRVTDSTLSFETKLDLAIAEFLDLSFSSRSEQRASYRYIPALSERVGQEPVNPFIDILRSFNFFNEADRIRSDFNLSSISLDAVHYLGDWELTVDYTGTPKVSADASSYVWDSSLSIFVRWYPIPEIKRTVSYQDNQLGI